MSMKKKLFTIIMSLAPLFFISPPADAQLRVGITGGVKMSSLIRDNSINANAGKLGYIVGANTKLNLGELGWFVRSGVFYSLEGDSQQSLNFVSVPLILGLDMSDEVNIFIAYDLAWQVGNDNNVQDFYQSYANMIGMGAEVHVSEKFAIGFRLNYGLSNLVKEPADAKNFTVKPLTFDLYLTYYIF